MKRFSQRLFDSLSNGGWWEGRYALNDLPEFKEILGEALHPIALKALSEFAGVSLRNRVFFDAYYVRLDFERRWKLPAHLSDACPIAMTCYHDDCYVWIDTKGNVFLLSPDEYFYVASSLDKTLELLAFGEELETAPPELQPGSWEVPLDKDAE